MFYNTGLHVLGNYISLLALILIKSSVWFLSLLPLTFGNGVHFHSHLKEVNFSVYQREFACSVTKLGNSGNQICRKKGLWGSYVRWVVWDDLKARKKILAKVFSNACWVSVFSFESLLAVKYFSREFKYISNIEKQWLNYTYVLSYSNLWLTSSVLTEANQNKQQLSQDYLLFPKTLKI